MSATRSGCRTRREPPEAPAQRRPVTPGPGPAPVARLRGQTASLLGACAADRPAERRVAIGDRELTASMVAVTGAIKITIHGQDISVVCARQPVPPDLTVVLLPIAPLRITPGTGPGLFADPVRRPGSAARFGCPAQPVSATSLSPSSAASRVPPPRPDPAAPKPGTRRRPVRGDSRESGWSISVGRQTSGAEPQEHGRTGVADMTIADKTVLVTGANRGIGQELVEEALARGAKRVYAGTRQPMAHPDGRVTPLTLDGTDAAQIQAAAGKVESLDVLINNAGIALFDDLSAR